MYREKWTAKWATEVQYEQVRADYVRVLERLTGDEVRRGLDLCLEEADFPPDPAGFFKLAKRRELTNGTNGQAYRLFRVDRALTKKRSPEEAAAGREAMRGLRDALRGGDHHG